MERLRVVRFGFLQFVQLAVDISAGIIATRRERIALNRRIAIPQSTVIVLQLDLRDRAVEIRLREIWLEVDDLVEILDGEYVILKIQRIPSDCGDTVGVQLRISTKGQSTKYQG